LKKIGANNNGTCGGCFAHDRYSSGVVYKAHTPFPECSSCQFYPPFMPPDKGIRMTNKKNKHNTVNVTAKNKADEKSVIAQTHLNPSVLSALSIKGYHSNDQNLDINALIAELNSETNKVRANDLSVAENILTTQAHTLNALFTEMIGRSRTNMGEYFYAAEKYMRLALKAQSQCRATLESLAEIKNPKPYIQNNKAQYQQVNNGVSENLTRAEKIKSSNELLEDQNNDEQWMDTREAETAIRNDQAM